MQYYYYRTFTALDWTDVSRGTKIDYDLEAHPLQIKTDSAAGSSEEVQVQLYTGDNTIGSIYLYFSEYFIESCNTYVSGYPVATPPAEQDKIWTISKTSTTLKIVCNGVEVLTYTFSESTQGNCPIKWSQDVTGIQFPSGQAADGYRQQPGTQ